MMSKTIKSLTKDYKMFFEGILSERQLMRHVAFQRWLTGK